MKDMIKLMADNVDDHFCDYIDNVDMTAADRLALVKELRDRFIAYHANATSTDTSTFSTIVSDVNPILKKSIRKRYNIPFLGLY